MKKSIHPSYTPTTINCSCGNTMTVASTRQDIRVETCSKCHPFYTGRKRQVDTDGRIGRFQKRFHLEDQR